MATTSHPPSLASLNCEQYPGLCLGWATTPPTVMHITLPQTVGAPTDIRVVHLNTTAVTKDDILELRSQAAAAKVPLYTGIFHPFDGPLAKAQLNEYVGTALYYLSAVPSWAYLLGISLFSRIFM